MVDEASSIDTEAASLDIGTREEKGRRMKARRE
jgi:hypothetical protein